MTGAQWQAFDMATSAPTFIKGQAQVYQSGNFYNFNYRGVGETTYAAMPGSLTSAQTDLDFAIAANVGKIYQFEGFLVGTSVSSGVNVRQNILVTSQTLVSGGTTSNSSSATSSESTPSVETGTAQLVNAYNFLDGGSSSNNAYASTNVQTNVSFAPNNPGGTAGTTPWEADFANLALTYGTRLGGKAASMVQTDDATAWANIKTTFTTTTAINRVSILGSVFFHTTGKTMLTGLYLQSSLDSTTWTTVKELPIPSNLSLSGSDNPGIVVTFDGFTIAANSYIRFGVGLSASENNAGFQFSGMEFYSIAS
jgi:hypothetical protein